MYFGKKNYLDLSIVVYVVIFISLNFGSISPAAISTNEQSSDEESSETKYVLRLPVKNLSPFYAMGEGNSSFIHYKCEFNNCFVTDNVNYFSGADRDFDAVVFHGRLLKDLKPYKTLKRSPSQKYIFGMKESPGNYPICSKDFDGFFNWTWTYKLNSDFRWGYFTIYDKNGNFVGPKADMHWIKDMEPISGELKDKLSRKTKAAAWFVSNCHSKNGRENFGAQVQKELKTYGWSVDVFGKCGPHKCPRTDVKKCNQKIEDEYYFYFSFENTFAEDYVTEKLNTALNNYAVPVVFGGANYSRFLPEGSYLDGRKLGPKKLAKAMDEIIRNKTMYYDFFRWRNHYVYKDTSDNSDICNLCAMLNDEKVQETSVVNSFRAWWNGGDYERECSRNKKTNKPKHKKS